MVFVKQWARQTVKHGPVLVHPLLSFTISGYLDFLLPPSQLTSDSKVLTKATESRA